MKAHAPIRILLLLAAIALPMTAEAGGKAKKSGKSPESVKKSAPGIESMALGNPDAAYRIGRIYETESKAPENFKEAARYYAMAAAKGHGAGKERLAYLLATGRAGRADGDRVKRLLGGSLDGLTKYEIFEIAIAFDEGLKMPADGEFALHLYLNTQARLVEDAEVRAAAILSAGKAGARKDPALAEKLLLRYAERNGDTARVRREIEPLLRSVRGARTETAGNALPTEDGTAIR